MKKSSRRQFTDKWRLTQKDSLEEEILKSLHLEAGGITTQPIAHAWRAHQTRLWIALEQRDVLGIPVDGRILMAEVTYDPPSLNRVELFDEFIYLRFHDCPLGFLDRVKPARPPANSAAWRKMVYHRAAISAAGIRSGDVGVGEVWSIRPNKHEISVVRVHSLPEMGSRQGMIVEMLEGGKHISQRFRMQPKMLVKKLGKIGPDEEWPRAPAGVRSGKEAWVAKAAAAVDAPLLQV